MKQKVEPILTPWENIPTDLDNLAGFVYEIIHKKTGKRYIGKKFYWSKTSKLKAGKTRRTHTTKESDWRTYKSSSDELQKWIESEGVDAFYFIILRSFKNRSQVNYYELHLQIARDILHVKDDGGEFLYLNSNIARRYYRNLNIHEDSPHEKIACIVDGKTVYLYPDKIPPNCEVGFSYVK